MHLLESGTYLGYIQELLGHKSSKRAEIYTHVSNKDIGKIKSPLQAVPKLKACVQIKEYPSYLG